jgi:hypothetical protein
LKGSFGHEAVSYAVLSGAGDFDVLRRGVFLSGAAVACCEEGVATLKSGKSG